VNPLLDKILDYHRPQGLASEVSWVFLVCIEYNDKDISQWCALIKILTFYTVVQFLAISRGSVLGDNIEREAPSLCYKLTCYPMRDGYQTLSAGHFIMHAIFSAGTL